MTSPELSSVWSSSPALQLTTFAHTIVSYRPCANVIPGGLMMTTAVQYAS